MKKIIKLLSFIIAMVSVLSVFGCGVQETQNQDTSEEPIVWKSKIEYEYTAISQGEWVVCNDVKYCLDHWSLERSQYRFFMSTRNETDSWKQVEVKKWFLVDLETEKCYREELAWRDNVIYYCYKDTKAWRFFFRCDNDNVPTKVALRYLANEETILDTENYVITTTYHYYQWNL